ncbi:hypothetical protein NHP200010_06700 [Helicobacter bizzozeronii]|nr:hypothetical protein NHP200010_06700 [Helicobacter bizzozeronii]
MWVTNMSFKFAQGALWGILLANLCLGTAAPDPHKRTPIQEKQFQIYMLKGQLYEVQQAQLDKQVAKRKSGVFMGVVLAELNLKVDGVSNGSFPLLYGVRVGYQQYLKGGVVGLRYYGEYLGGVAGSVLKDNQSSSYQIASLNVDLVMDKPIDAERKYAIGVFGGLGLGWNGYKDYPKATRNPNGFGVIVNFGVAITLNTKHRIELALKIPPLKSTHAFSYSLTSGNIYYISYNFLL